MGSHRSKVMIGALIGGLAVLQIECCRFGHASLEKRRHRTAVRELRRRQYLCNEQNNVTTQLIGGCSNSMFETNYLGRMRFQLDEAAVRDVPLK